MTTNAIIAMAEQAGYPHVDLKWNDQEQAFLMRFAALVAAAEREACAQVSDAETERARFNWRSDLPSNQQFWNGAEQFASACSASIRAKDKP